MPVFRVSLAISPFPFFNPRKNALKYHRGLCRPICFPGWYRRTCSFTAFTISRVRHLSTIDGSFNTSRSLADEKMDASLYIRVSAASAYTCNARYTYMAKHGYLAAILNVRQFRKYPNNNIFKRLYTTILLYPYFYSPGHVSGWCGEPLNINQ